MEIVRQEVGAIVLFALNGRLDTNTATDLEKTLLQEINRNTNKIVIDCAGLDFITSSGLRVLLLAAKKLKAIDGKVVLCTLQEHVKNIFEVAGFTMLLSIYPSRQQAIDAI